MPTPKLTDAELQATVDAHAAEGGSVSKAAAKLGIGQSTFGQRMRLAKDKGLVPQAAPKLNGEAKRVGHSLSEFQAQHDKDFIVPARIKEGLKQLGDGWAYEMEFVKLAGVSLGDLGNYREQFVEYVVVVRRDGKRAWAGTLAIAAKMREMIA